ncbi:MAG TPA: hypothetical protein VGG78_10240 [Gemmatimonadaceae bacterium]
MLAPLVAMLLQATAPQAPAPSAKPAAASDTTAADSVDRGGRRRPRRPAKRIPVTAEHLATAYGDAGAKSLLLLARAARMHQDSALQAYDATTYQRVSAGLGFSKLGRDRLAFRSETATRVQWRRGIGAYVDVTGARTVIPIAGKSGSSHMEGELSPIPYFPGSETLWIGSSVARQAVDENDGIVNPIADGSEAYYTFASGDSVTFRLPDSRTIRLRELRVRPRMPSWRLAVGSLWFDTNDGHLVRAAYRMSVPMDIKAVAEEKDSTAFKDVPAWVKPMMFPMSAQVSAIGVEYGLFQGRFWLPRLQVAEGSASLGFMHLPFKLEQKFQYDRVNAGDALPPIPVSTDSSRVDGMDVNVDIGGPDAPKTARDSLRARRHTARMKCDSTGTRSFTRHREGAPNLVLVRVPCDSARLANSPDLPPSIYDKGDEVFGGAEMDALVSQALSMSTQAGYAPQLPVLNALNPRYNRVEGLSLGGRVDQELGAGYSVHALGRIGVADREPNVELTGSRSDLRRTLSLTAYNRLVSASDWGNPLSLGSSISAFLFGRDEGFYYRASGIELASTPDEPSGGGITWGLFAEQQRTATQRTTFSLARALHGSAFEPNLDAERGAYYGFRTRWTNAFGLDPQGFRLFSDARFEGAHGDTTTYGRAALDLTASHGIGNGAAALTLAAGSGMGVVPAQRLWYLGGAQTLRGERPGAAVGDAFWLARGEYAYGLEALRPVAFADFGWAGDRRQWRELTMTGLTTGTVSGRPMSGVGVGATLLDGLVRFDVARGLFPERQWRVDTYVEARF